MNVDIYKPRLDIPFKKSHIPQERLPISDLRQNWKHFVDKLAVFHFNNGDNDAIKFRVWRSNGPGSTPDGVYTGTFVNVLDNSIIIGSEIPDSSHKSMASTTSAINFNTGVGVLKIEDSDGGTFNENDFLIIQIITPEDWAGNIDAISVRTGASETTLLGTSGFTPT